MADGFYSELGSRAPDASALILRLERPDNQPPLQFPAMVRNLAAGVVTLEVNNPWTIMNWEGLKGQGGCLKLLTTENEGAVEIRGTVTWARYAVLDHDNGQLCLNLKLEKLGPAERKLLLDHIPQTTKDIKSLWNRWEQVRLNPEPEAFSTKVGLAAVALLIGGIAVYQAAPEPFKILHWVLWASGASMVASQTLHFFRHR